MSHHQSSFSFTKTAEGRAMLLSLVVGVIIVVIKVSAFWVSGSMAMMADMLESLVHNLAVLFAAYCLWYSFLPPDSNHLYGHGKIQFLSSAIEGALVCLAGLMILFNCARVFVSGYVLLDVSSGVGLATLAALINGVLGWWLIRVGKQKKLIILVADGKHILSDVVTTGAALIGVILASLTGIVFIDLLAAFIGGLYILSVGGKLMRESVAGLMDEADRQVDQRLRGVLADEANEHAFDYHKLRHRTEGNRHWIELHLVMDDSMSLEEAHSQASHIEEVIQSAFDESVIITTHLEPRSSQSAVGSEEDGLSASSDSTKPDSPLAE